MNLNFNFPPEASSYAGEIDFGIRLLQWSMLLIFVTWGVYMAYLLFRYRRRAGVPAAVPPGREWQALAAGAAVLVLEGAMIAFYDIPVWGKIRETFPPDASSNIVEVVAEQFAWNFQYPGPDGKFGRRDPQYISSTNTIGLDPNDPNGKDNVVVVGELHVPIGKPTILRLSSKDVIHDFFVPAFRMKTDVVPGLQVQEWFEPTSTGTYEAACAQLCGLGHTTMRATVVVQSPDDYKAWLASQLQAQQQGGY